jgi:hypothetical protein
MEHWYPRLMEFHCNLITCSQSIARSVLLQPVSFCTSLGREVVEPAFGCIRRRDFSLLYFCQEFQYLRFGGRLQGGWSLGDTLR